MNAEDARRAIEEVCAEIDARKERRSLARRVGSAVATAGLGLMLGLGALTGCGDDDNGKKTPDVFYPGGDMYGVPDTISDQAPLPDAGPDLPMGGDMYGIPDQSPDQ